MSVDVDCGIGAVDKCTVAGFLWTRRASGGSLRALFAPFAMDGGDTDIVLIGSWYTRGWRVNNPRAGRSVDVKNRAVSEEVI